MYSIRNVCICKKLEDGFIEDKWGKNWFKMVIHAVNDKGFVVVASVFDEIRLDSFYVSSFVQLNVGNSLSSLNWEISSFLFEIYECARYSTKVIERWNTSLTKSPPNPCTNLGLLESVYFSTYYNIYLSVSLNFQRSAKKKTFNWY